MTIKLSDWAGVKSIRSLSYTSGILQASQLDTLLAADIPHNLNALPDSLELWVEQGGGQWEQHDPSAYVLADDTNLVNTGTTLASVLGATTLVRLTASSGPVAISVGLADSGQAGLIAGLGNQTLSPALSLENTLSILPTTNQLVLGTTNTTTISATAPASSAVYTIPDAGGAADFVLTAGAQTIGGAKTFSDSISSDAAHMGGYGLVPVGAIVAYNPGYYTSTSNGGFTRVGPGSNDAAGVNAFLNAKGWYVCDGAAVNNANSPIWNAAGRNLPNLNDSRFLMGSTSAGTAAGSNANRSVAHTHSVTSNVTAAAITLSTANLPAHNHSMAHTHTIDHGHTASSAAAGAHDHDMTWWGGGGAAGNRYFTSSDFKGGAGPGAITGHINSNGSHSHTITVNGHSGNSGGASTTNTGNSGSGTSFTPSLTNNAVNSGGMSANSSISILPQYLTTFYIVRVF